MRVAGRHAGSLVCRSQAVLRLKPCRFSSEIIYDLMFKVYRDDVITYIYIYMIVIEVEVEVGAIIKHICSDAIIAGHSYLSRRLYPSSVPLSRHPAHLRPLSSW